MSLESDLIDIFKSDITILKEQISQNHSFLDNFIRRIDSYDSYENIYFIEYYIFEDLINRYCYDINNQNYDPFIGFVPPDKLSIFREVFLIDMDFSTPRTIECHGNNYVYSEERIYNLLFYHIFTQSIFTESSIEDIFNQALKDWKTSLERYRMPIYIDTLLVDTRLVDIDENEVLISNKFKIKYNIHYSIVTGRSLENLDFSYLWVGTILRLETFQSFYHNFSRTSIHQPIYREDPVFREEFKDIMNKINECIISFYLNNFNFALKGYEIYQPWWVRTDKKKYERPAIRLGENRLTSQDIDLIINLYNQIHEINLLQDNELELALFNYMESHQKSLISELILYDFIILENIFTRGSSSEVTFRLALNLALFISSSRDEMSNIFEITKRLYNTRSKIIHGEEWYNSLRRSNIPNLLSLNVNINNRQLARAVHNKLLHLINRSLIKIIKLKIENFARNNNYQIMSDFRDLYFLLNSSVFHGA